MTNRECITKSEYLEVLDLLKKETKVYSEVYSSTTVPTGKRLYYYKVEIDIFENLPSFFGTIHANYGRMIDIAIEYTDVNSSKLYLYIRGYSKDLNK